MQQTTNSAPSPAISDLQQQLHTIQQSFQEQILSLNADLALSSEPRVVSYQTEFSKQLQLLGIDLMFLQAARQQETIQQRQTQLRHRLQTLISYCDALSQKQAGKLGR